jgi:hypothetical protein
MTTALWCKDRYYNLLLLSKNNNNKLNAVEERELSSYKIILENQIYYNQRDFYLSFIEEYLRENAAGTYGTGLFIYEFFALDRESQGDCRALEAEILETGISRLENFSINSESTKFGELIEDIFGECEFYDKDISDESFRSLIREALLEMKECVATYNDSEALQSVMVFFVFVSAIPYSVLDPTLFNLVWR